MSGQANRTLLMNTTKFPLFGLVYRQDKSKHSDVSQFQTIRDLAYTALKEKGRTFRREIRTKP